MKNASLNASIAHWCGASAHAKVVGVGVSIDISGLMLLSSLNRTLEHLGLAPKATRVGLTVIMSTKKEGGGVNGEVCRGGQRSLIAHKQLAVHR